MLNTGSTGRSASGFHLHGDNLEKDTPLVETGGKKTRMSVAESYKFRRKTRAAPDLVISAAFSMGGVVWLFHEAASLDLGYRLDRQICILQHFSIICLLFGVCFAVLFLNNIVGLLFGLSLVSFVLL